MRVITSVSFRPFSEAVERGNLQGYGIPEVKFKYEPKPKEETKPLAWDDTNEIL